MSASRADLDRYLDIVSKSIEKEILGLRASLWQEKKDYAAEEVVSEDLRLLRYGREDGTSFMQLYIKTWAKRQYNVVNLGNDFTPEPNGYPDTLKMLGRFITVLMRRSSMLSYRREPEKDIVVPVSLFEELHGLDCIPAANERRPDHTRGKEVWMLALPFWELQFLGDETRAKDEMRFEMNPAPPTLALDAAAICRASPTERNQSKSALLAPHLLHPIRKVVNLLCTHDHHWSLELLNYLAPHLEELQLRAPTCTHLAVLEKMPNLDRLDVEFCTEHLGRRIRNISDEFIFSPLPHTFRGLSFLRVAHLPRKTTYSLIYAHRATLKELWMAVGTWNPQAKGERGLCDRSVRSIAYTAPRDMEDWPNSCRSVQFPLKLCFVTEPLLKRIVFFRWLYVHDKTSCEQQLAAVREELPHVSDVACFECSNMTALPEL